MVLKYKINPTSSASDCLDLAILLLTQEALQEANAEDLKLCHLTNDKNGRFSTRRYKCINDRDCRVYEPRNDRVDALRTVLSVLKYIAVLCLPWLFTAYAIVANRKRFAVISPHLWRTLDGSLLTRNEHRTTEKFSH